MRAGVHMARLLVASRPGRCFARGRATRPIDPGEQLEHHPSADAPEWSRENHRLIDRTRTQTYSRRGSQPDSREGTESMRSFAVFWLAFAVHCASAADLRAQALGQPDREAAGDRMIQ